MMLKILQFLALILTALSLVPGGAHALELPSKIRLDKERYLVVQQLYRGWALAALPLLGAVLITLALAILSRAQLWPMLLSAAACVLLVATIVSFFIWVFPVNRTTGNWTTAPENWSALRSRWEYAHAVNAAITLVALVCIVLAVLAWSPA